MPLTETEKKILARVGSDLYDIAKPTRFDVDSVFVKVRRSALEELAATLKAIREGVYAR